MSLKVTDRDNGYRKFRAEIFDDGVHKLEVGVFREDGSVSYPDGVTVLQVAMWNEFGTRTAPARSFIRAWFDENQDVVVFWFKGEMTLCLQGKQTKQQALAKVGQKCVKGIRNRILAGILPENARATVAKKGSSIPLIESKFLMNAIDYQVDGTKHEQTSRLVEMIKSIFETAVEAVEGIAEDVVEGIEDVI